MYTHIYRYIYIYICTSVGPVDIHRKKLADNNAKLSGRGAGAQRSSVFSIPSGGFACVCLKMLYCQPVF